MIILGSQVKDNLLKRINKSPFFSIVTDKVTDVANEKFSCILKKGIAGIAFIDSMELLHASKRLMQQIQKQYTVV